MAKVDLGNQKIKLSKSQRSPLTVKQLFDECRSVFEEQGRAEKAQATLNERFVSGRQFWEFRGDTNNVAPSTVPDHIPRVTRNLMANLGLTWTAICTSDMPSVKAYATHAESGDLGASDVANAVIDHQRARHSFDAMIVRDMMQAQSHGSIAWVARWNPDGGPKSDGVPVLDENGAPTFDEDGQALIDGVGERLGEIEIDTLTIFDYATDGSEHPEQSQWLLCRRVIDKYQASSMLERAGIKDEPQVSHQKGAWGEEFEGVEAWELWHVPGSRIPAGLHALFVGDVCTSVGDYPLEHEQLPISVCKIKERRGSPFGDTHVTDAVPQQRRLNDLLSALARLVQLAGDVKGIGSSAITDQWTTGAGFIPVDSPDVAKNFTFVVPPPIPRDLYELLDRYEKGLADVYGVNEVVSGADPGASSNAKHAAYISALNAQKFAMARHNLSQALVRLFDQVIALTRQYVKAPRLLEMVGPDGAIKVQQFQGADLSGVSVRLEPSPGVEQYRGTQAHQAEEAGAAGWIDPAQANELRQTGLPQTLDEGATRRAVLVQIGQAMGGAFVEADPNLDPNVAAETVEQAIALYAPGGGQTVMPLRALAQHYREIAAQAQAPVDPAGQAPSGRPDVMKPVAGSGPPGVMP